MTRFNDPDESLRDLDAEIVAAVIDSAADLALVLDRDGIIRDLCRSESLTADRHGSWIGKAWVDTVTIESRTKVRDLLRDALAGTPARPRQVNHPARNGPDLPVLYSIVRLGQDRVMALGRDLSGVAALQQRLVEAQQAIERDYARLRRVETRYRVLFQMSSEAALIVDSATHKIEEANPAAGRLLGQQGVRLSGVSVLDSFESDSKASIRALLANVRASGQTSEVRVRAQEGHRELVLSASLFRQDQTVLFLVQLSPTTPEEAAPLSGSRSRLLDLAESAPDGLVVTDREGRVQSANATFLGLVELAGEAQAIGQSLDRWLGRPAVDLSLLTSGLRDHGSVRLYATNLRGELGTLTEVEISAVAMSMGEPPGYGFSVRNVGRRLGQEPAADRPLSRSAEQLTELVGRVPLKDLIRETTDVIERLCIEAALELTEDNRASAAEMLGLSRQSLYVKLRRYGIGELEPDDEA